MPRPLVILHGACELEILVVRPSFHDNAGETYHYTSRALHHLTTYAVSLFFFDDASPYITVKRPFKKNTLYTLASCQTLPQAKKRRTYFATVIKNTFHPRPSALYPLLWTYDPLGILKQRNP